MESCPGGRFEFRGVRAPWRGGRLDIPKQTDPKRCPGGTFRPADFLTNKTFAVILLLLLLSDVRKLYLANYENPAYHPYFFPWTGRHSRPSSQGARDRTRDTVPRHRAKRHGRASPPAGAAMAVLRCHGQGRREAGPPARRCHARLRETCKEAEVRAVTKVGRLRWLKQGGLRPYGLVPVVAFFVPLSRNRPPINLSGRRLGDIPSDGHWKHCPLCVKSSNPIGSLTGYCEQ